MQHPKIFSQNRSWGFACETGKYNHLGIRGFFALARGILDILRYHVVLAGLEIEPLALHTAG